MAEKQKKPSKHTSLSHPNQQSAGHSSKEQQTSNIGLTVKKSQDISEWYSQVIIKADLIDYTSVSGCYIFKPAAFGIWEHIQAWFDTEIKKLGVKNAYFPLLLPESLFNREKEHVAGFSPEVAWVTHGGHTQLSERLAIRPTSETIICDAFSRWVRSWRDLPIKINQWCNIVRWEFKHPNPFFRTREFLWQEGHTVHSEKEEAEALVKAVLTLYQRVFEELLAVPAYAGQKTEAEKFAGADYTLSIETFMPNGKFAQGATSHYLGHHFAHAFGINYLDQSGKSHPAHSTSWGLSTRSIGPMIMIHGDDKGLVVPPRVAPIKAVIVPILFDDSKEKVLHACKNLKKSLSTTFSVELDDREGYTAGYKFNHWELRGIPIRIEIGPKDQQNGTCILVRRDTGTKESIPIDAVPSKLPALLEEIQSQMLERARNHIFEKQVHALTIEAIKKGVKDQQFVWTPWCESSSCEQRLIKEIESAKIIHVPTIQPHQKPPSCAICQGKGKVWVTVGKSY